MPTARALMFVHLGMDVEEQWEKAVDSLMHMSNLEIALVWRKLSSFAPLRDYRVHSEYKCLFKRAVREAERRVGASCFVSSSSRSREEGGGVDDGGESDTLSMVHSPPGYEFTGDEPGGGYRNGRETEIEGAAPFSLVEQNSSIPNLDLYQPSEHFGTGHTSFRVRGSTRRRPDNAMTRQRYNLTKGIHETVAGNL